MFQARLSRSHTQNIYSTAAPCLHSLHTNNRKWHSKTYKLGLKANWEFFSKAEVWLPTLLCRSSLPGPANRWIRTREQRSHDQYSAVYSTSEKTLARRSLEHTHSWPASKAISLHFVESFFLFSLVIKVTLLTCWEALLRCIPKISALLQVHLSNSNNRTAKQQDWLTKFYLLKITSTCKNETGPPVNRADPTPRKA